LFVLDAFFNDFDNDGNLDIITITTNNEPFSYIMNFNSITSFGISTNKNILPIKIIKNEMGLYKII